MLTHYRRRSDALQGKSTAQSKVETRAHNRAMISAKLMLPGTLSRTCMESADALPSILMPTFEPYLLAALGAV